MNTCIVNQQSSFGGQWGAVLIWICARFRLCAVIITWVQPQIDPLPIKPLCIRKIVSMGQMGIMVSRVLNIFLGVLHQKIIARPQNIFVEPTSTHGVELFPPKILFDCLYVLFVCWCVCVCVWPRRHHVTDDNTSHIHDNTSSDPYVTVFNAFSLNSTNIFLIKLEL